MNNEINLDEEITIICKRHGEFKMKAKDHIGENDEKVAYGCPNCKCDVQLDNQGSKTVKPICSKTFLCSLDKPKHLFPFDN